MAAVAPLTYTVAEFARFKVDLPILDELNSYLTDIISSIEEEICSSITKYYGENEAWRTRKNPNFMLKFGAKDKIFLDLNQNLNKITNINWQTIVKVLNGLIGGHVATTSDPEQLQLLVSTLIGNILDKSLAQEIFTEFYIKTLLSINVPIVIPYIKTEVAALMTQFYDLLEKGSDGNRLAQDNIVQYKNVGHFFGCLYNEKLLKQVDILRVLPKFIRTIADSLEWEPINKVVVESNINVLCGFLNPTLKTIWTTVDRDSQQDLECQLNILTHHANLPQRIKFHLMDIDDKIGEARKLKIRAAPQSHHQPGKFSYANIATTGTSAATKK